MIGERRIGNDLGDGGRGLKQALFRDLGGGNEKSQYGEPVLQPGFEPVSIRI